MKSTILLAGASVVALTIGAQSAQAASPTVIYGGGSTLAAKIYRDIFNCFATTANGIFSTTPATYPAGVAIAFPTGENTACTKQNNSGVVVGYEPVGSGAGLTAWETANGTGFGTPATTNTIAYLDNTAKITSTPYPEIQFAGSDAYLTGQDSTAAATVGETVFQLPTFVTPIVMAFGQIQNVKLTTTDVCDLFASATNETAGKTKVSTLVVRSDGSGTSFIFSDWLAKNCPTNLGFNSANGFPSTTPNWTAVAAANGNHLPILKESGSGGVASTVASTSRALGYVSPDYTYPVVASSTAYPTYVNGIQPTVAAVKQRLAKETYPTTYNTSSVGQQINDQLVAPGEPGYPIIGYTFIDTYSCYSKSIASGHIGIPAQGKFVLNLLNFLYGTTNTSVNNMLAAQGFAVANPTVVKLLKSAGGPLNATGGIQNASCPST